MTVIATATDPRFRVSRVDVDRDGPTYTVDTLRDLRAEYAAQGERARAVLHHGRRRAELDRELARLGRGRLARAPRGRDAARPPAARPRPARGCASRSSRSRRSPSPRPTAATGSRTARRSATSSRTASWSTSRSAGCTPEPPREHRSARRHAARRHRGSPRPPVPASDAPPAQASTIGSAVEVAGSYPAATIVPGVSDPAVPGTGESSRASRRRAAEEAAEVASQDSRRRVLIVTGVVLGLLAAIVAVWALIGRGGTGDPVADPTPTATGPLQPTLLVQVKDAEGIAVDNALLSVGGESGRANMISVPQHRRGRRRDRGHPALRADRPAARPGRLGRRAQRRHRRQRRRHPRHGHARLLRPRRRGRRRGRRRRRRRRPGAGRRHGARRGAGREGPHPPGPPGCGVRDLPRAGRAGGGAHGALRPGAAPRRGQAAAATCPRSRRSSPGSVRRRARRCRPSRSPRSSCVSTPTCSPTTSTYRNLPVKPLNDGSTTTTAYRVDTEEAAAMVTELLPDAARKPGPNSKVRVLVQNGVGSPGLNAAARQLLVDAGYTFVNGGNAATLGERTTSIVVPDSSAESLRVGQRHRHGARRAGHRCAGRHAGSERRRRHRRAGRRLHAHGLTPQVSASGARPRP